MKTTPSIVFRDIPASAGLDADVRARLARLERYCPSLIGGRLLIEPAGRHHRDGNRFHVRIDLTVPGREIVVSHELTGRNDRTARRRAAVRKRDEPDPALKLLGVAIRRAFDVARRQLQDYARRQRGDVKTHASGSERPSGRPSATVTPAGGRTRGASIVRGSRRSR